MKLTVLSFVSVLALVAAQPPPLPVTAPQKITPLMPPCPAPNVAPPAPAPPALALPSTSPPNITPMVPACPAPAPGPAPPAPAPAPPAPIKLPPFGNPVVSMIQSVFRPPQPAPKPTGAPQDKPAVQPAPKPKPTTTYKTEPISFALSNISFGSTLVPATKPTQSPKKEEKEKNSTPGTILFCTSTTYDFWPSGDTCTLVGSELNKCLNLDEKLKKKVLAVKPDKGQLCLLFDDEDCFGKAEWVKWPGVRDLRGRIGDGGSWERRVVSFRCSEE